MKKPIKFSLPFYLVIIVVLVWLYLTRPISIGIVLTTDTTLGHEENQAIHFYKSKFPRIGLRKVEYLIRNPPLEKEKIVQAYREVEEAGASVIIGGSISRTGIILAEESASSKVPTFGITTSSQKLSGKKDHYFRIVPSTQLQAAAVADFFHSQKCTSLALITSTINKAYSVSYAEMIQKSFQGEVRIIPFEPEKRPLDELLSWKPDAAFCIVKAANLIQVIKEVKQRKADIQLIASAWGSFELLTLYSGPMLDGVFLTSQRGTLMPEYEQLVMEFEEVYELKTDFASGNTFSILNIIYQALRQVGDDRARINAYLEKPRFYDIAYGKVYVDAFGDAVAPYYYIYEVVKGKRVLKERIKLPQYPWDKE